jgi:hypothetical protein
MTVEECLKHPYLKEFVGSENEIVCGKLINVHEFKKSKSTHF